MSIRQKAKKTAQAALGIGGAFLFLWEFPAFRKFLAWATTFDFFYERIRDPSWVGRVINAMIYPPPGTALLVALVGLVLIYWSTKPRETRMSPPIIGMLICVIGFAVFGIWYLVRNQNQQLVAAPQQAADESVSRSALSPFEWGFEHYPGYPFIGMLGGKHANPPVVFQFQARGRNNTKDPIVKARAYVRSDRTGAIYEGLFNVDGQFFGTSDINPIPVDAIIDIHAYFDPQKKPLSIEKFLSEIAPLTFFFEYDGKQYRRSFSQSEIEMLVRRFESETRPKTPPPRMSAKARNLGSPPTFAQLLALHDGHSGIEAAELLKPFKGALISPTSGKIGVMSPDGDSDGAMVVIRNDSNALECHFDGSWRPQLSQHKEGDVLRITGKISHFTGPSLLVLMECEIAK